MNKQRKPFRERQQVFFRITHLPIVLVMSIVMISCSNDTSVRPVEPLSYTAVANQLVFSITPRGLKSPGKSRSFVTHSVWLYGDKRVIAVRRENKAGKANLSQRYISDEAMTKILRMAAAIDLAEKDRPKFGKPADPFPRDGNSRRNLVHLQAGNVSRSWDITESVHPGIDEGLTEREKTRRAVLGKITGRLLPQDSDTVNPYAPDKSVLIAEEVGQASSQAPERSWPTTPIDQSAKSWEGTKHNGTRCIPVSEATAQVKAALREDTTQTPVWRSNGKLYNVRVHPLLPDATDCASAHAYLPDAAK